MEMRPASYFILAALIERPLHGYAIGRRAAELSGGEGRPSTRTLDAVLERALAGGLGGAGRPDVAGGGEVRPSTGTLYAVLERALADGLVVAGEPYVAGGRARRDYTLTPTGRGALEAEAQRMARAARTVARRLGATAAAVAR